MPGIAHRVWSCCVLFRKRGYDAGIRLEKSNKPVEVNQSGSPTSEALVMREPPVT